MSLDTVLQIGKTLRNSEDNLKYFKYVEPCPKDKDGNWPICITIPVKNDYSFDFEGMKFTPENQRENLYFLKFKTSNSDGMVKYIFGDIYYEKKVKIKNDGTIDIDEGGYYRLENPMHSNPAYRTSSFIRGINDYNDIIKSYKENSPKIIQQFHESLEKNIKHIESILKYAPAISELIENGENNKIIQLLENEYELYKYTITFAFLNTTKNKLRKIGIPDNLAECNETQKKLLFDCLNFKIFIHFEFPGNLHWYNFPDDMNLLNSKLFSEFVEETPEGLVLKKTLYKTLCSGDKKNDIQFPFFSENNKYKAKSFTIDTLQDLFYAVDFTSKGKQINSTDLKLIVLPRGINLSAADYEEFFKKRNESKLLAQNKEKNNSSYDPLFDFLFDDKKNITSFDLILCNSNRGSQSSPDKDLIELSGIEKSKLRLINERINEISREISKERKNFIHANNELFPLNIEYSFQQILGMPLCDPNTGKVSFKISPKYQSHILKVLPLIYTDNYTHDEELLSSFIQNVEFSIRADDQKFIFLKYDLKFLLKIQNTKIDKFMEITSSESYQIGFLLGTMAKNLSQEINSFEKNYVGNLRRRIATLADFIKLKNEIEEKLIMHDKTKFTFQTSYELAQKIKEFKSKYDKDECAFGFFEGYFKPIPSREASTSEEINSNIN
ncbi:hypothetical protein [Anaerorudis cellulosivorans]|uniref:hypothetical protein n=1 Tax=Anaerorudis cellulosivorans TaxID=3397862 RepID=UPI00222045F4|nr:hypothetical protein [Seramator thermalis]MCW1736000.1 hypothetical protein [Seramator thermalis]